MTDTRYEIYLIEAPGFWYVGSTGRRSADRFSEHMNGKGNQRVQELGPDLCVMTVMESGLGDALEAERRWYDHHLAHNPGKTMNGCRPGKWKEWTPESRAKASATHTGKPGRPHTPESKAKIGAANRGRVRSAEVKAKMRNAHIGKKTGPLSDEHRAKISAGLTKSHAERRRINK